MTQEAHTQGPWRFVPWHIEEGSSAVRAPDGHLICSTASDANARRIAACVNALAGIPIEAIESGVVAELKQYVVAFCGPWAFQYSRDFGLPEGHLHPTHYDILEKCGARMDDFTRAKLEASK